jgi:S-sulfo-L-cysteine synthase (O-acetyl-L-serine-dependent)
MAAMPGTEPKLAVLPPPLGSDLLELIGHTPLLRIRLFEDELPELRVYAKAEYRNPGGSVKDRPALRMITEGERSGRLSRGRVILDATSGNTGVAYAMIGAAKGHPVHLVMPRNVSAERRALVHAFGAGVTFSDPMEGSDGAIRLCREVLAADPDRYFMPDQYNNPENWLAHYHGTASEIWEQTRGTVTNFVAAVGTSGTFVGTGRRLRELNPGIRLHSVQPDSPWHGLEGLKHMESAIVPGIYDPNLADSELAAPTEEAYELARRLAATEGVLVGHSSGANLWGVREVGREIGRGVIVTILCDGGDRYLSSGLYGMTPT